MLSSIRKPYLSVDSRNPPLSRHQSRTIDISGGEQSWATIRHLTNEERDQIDLQARVVLTRCSDRVKEMEVIEKRTHSPSLSSWGSQNKCVITKPRTSGNCCENDKPSNAIPTSPASTRRCVGCFGLHSGASFKHDMVPQSTTHRDESISQRHARRTHEATIRTHKNIGFRRRSGSHIHDRRSHTIIFLLRGHL